MGIGIITFQCTHTRTCVELNQEVEFKTSRARTKAKKRKRAKLFNAQQAQRSVEASKLTRALDAERRLEHAQGEARGALDAQSRLEHAHAVKRLRGQERSCGQAVKTGQSYEEIMALKGPTKSVLKAISVVLEAKTVVHTDSDMDEFSDGEVVLAHLEEDTNNVSEKEYEVDEILEYNNEGPDEVWLVSWTGYPSDDNTWETKSSFNNEENDFTIKFVAFEKRRKHQGKGHNKGEH